MTTDIIAHDLERASTDNLEVYEETGSAGIASERCESCGRPLVVSGYGTWFGSRDTEVRLAHYTCECRHE
jgi:hypothetical protein